MTPQTSSEGVRRRRLTVAALVVLAACGLLFTGLAVSTAVNHGRPWILPLVSPVLTGVLVWLILRNRARRTRNDSPAGSPSAMFGRTMIVLALAGLCLVGLAIFLTGG